MILKVTYYFALDKANGLGKVYISNNTVFVYVNLKSNIEEFKRSEVPCVGILVHFNELHVGDGLIQNLKKGKAKWHKNYVLELSVSKSVK